MIAMMLSAAMFTSAEPWATDSSDSRCRLVREYRSGRTSIVIALTDIAGSSSLVTLDILVPDARTEGFEYAKAELSFEPSGEVQRPSYFSVSRGKQRQVQTTLDLRDGQGMTGASVLRVKANSVELSVVPGITKGAWSAFEACTADLRARLGLSQDETAMLAEPPIGPPNPQDWVSSDDYPEDALRARKEGMAVAVLTVGADGRVSDCRPVVSAGMASLDAVPCTLLRRRGRFRPALTKDGAPVRAHYVWRTTWALPTR